MNEKQFQKFVRKPFNMGVFLHTIVWLFIVNFDQTAFNFLCSEISCYTLTVIDIPFSIFYLGGAHIGVTFGSLFLGALSWGLIFLGFSKLSAFAKRKKNET